MAIEDMLSDFSYAHNHSIRFRGCRPGNCWLGLCLELLFWLEKDSRWGCGISKGGASPTESTRDGGLITKKSDLLRQNSNQYALLKKSGCCAPSRLGSDTCSPNCSRWGYAYSMDSAPNTTYQIIVNYTRITVLEPIN